MISALSLLRIAQLLSHTCCYFGSHAEVLHIGQFLLYFVSLVYIRMQRGQMVAENYTETQRMCTKMRKMVRLSALARVRRAVKR